MSITEHQETLGHDLALFTITTGELYTQACEIKDKGLGDGAWLGHVVKALGMYEKEVEEVKGMRHSFVIMYAASFVKDHYCSDLKREN